MQFMSRPTLVTVFLGILSPLSFVSCQQILPVTILHGAETTCSTDQEIEAAQQSITSNVHSILQSLQNVPPCGEGKWKKVISLNMSDPSQQCPSSWREYTSIRSCGRPAGSSGCASVIFSTNVLTYNKVCGRAVGYQYVSTDAFGRFIPQPSGTPDDNYVDGLSVTHGSNPRKHIWTFASGLAEPNDEAHQDHWRHFCPCGAPNDTRFGTPPPLYVGDNYFCEAGHSEAEFPNTHNSEPLWDGQGCFNSQCCTFNTPPWFSVQLPVSTSDYIEVRICGDQDVLNEDTTIRLLELYIQ